MTMRPNTGTICPAPATSTAHVRLRPHGLAPRVARRIVREQATGTLAPRLVDQCALLAGEMVTSAIRRTHRAVEFSLETDGVGVTLRVRDQQPLSRLAVGSDPWVGCPHGREITSRLTRSWGYSRTETGAELWVTLRDRQRPRPAASAA